MQPVQHQPCFYFSVHYVRDQRGVRHHAERRLPSPLSVGYFQTEASYDKVCTGSQCPVGPTGALYSGVGVNPNGVLASSIAWRSDGPTNNYGFKICLGYVPSPRSSLGA